MDEKCCQSPGMDKLPDELLQRILDCAMSCKTPFLLPCTQKKCWTPNTRSEYRKRKRALIEKFGQQYYSSYLCHHQSNAKFEPTQGAHLRDWRLIVGTCSRFRRLGKASFFSQQSFAMEPCQATSMQHSQFTFLSVENQQIAVNYISSIIFIISDLSSPSSFFTLSNRVPRFPRLVRLDHIFGFRHGEDVDLIVGGARDRRPVWSHFVEILALCGVPAERLDIGIMIRPETTWDHPEGWLKQDTYPVLRSTAKINAKQRVCMSLS